MLCGIIRSLKTHLVAQDIRDANKIVYIISKLMLICPYTIKSDLKFVVTKFDALIIILQISLFSWLTYDMFCNRNEFVSSEDVLKCLIHNIEICGVYSLYFYCFAYMHFYRNDVTQLLKYSLKSSKIMKQIGLIIDYTPHMRRNLYLFIFLIGINCCSSTIFISMRQNTDSLKVLVFISMLYYYFIVIYYCSDSFFYDIQVHFDYLCCKLDTFYTFKSVIKNIDHQHGGKRLVSDLEQIKKFKNIVKLYSILVTRCGNVNTVFYILLLLLIYITFFGVVSTIYYLASLIIDQKDIKTLFHTIIVAINWNTVNLAMMMCSYSTFTSIRNKVFIQVLIFITIHCNIFPETYCSVFRTYTYHLRSRDL